MFATPGDPQENDKLTLMRWNGKEWYPVNLDGESLFLSIFGDLPVYANQAAAVAAGAQPGMPYLSGQDPNALCVVNFTPDTITGLAGWWDADDGATVFEESTKNTAAADANDPIGGWADKSGAGNDLLQATAGKRPLLKLASINSRDSILTDGVDDFWQATFALRTPVTIFVVAKLAALPGAGTTKALIDGKTTTKLKMMVDETGKVNLNAGLALGPGTGPGLGIADPHLVSAVYDGDNSALWIDGTLADQGAVGIATPSPAGFTVGSLGSGVAGFANAYYCEILLYKTALSHSLRRKVQNYLCDRWGISLGN